MTTECAAAPPPNLQTQFHDPAACFARALLSISCPLMIGRRECRAPDAPAASHARKKRTSIVTTVTSVHPTFPAQWFTAYNALSPVTGLFCHCRLQVKTRKLDASVGRQDHTISPSAGPRSRLQRRLRPSHP